MGIQETAMLYQINHVNVTRFVIKVLEKVECDYLFLQFVKIYSSGLQVMERTSKGPTK